MFLLMRRPSRSTRTDTRFPCRTRFRSEFVRAHALARGWLDQSRLEPVALDQEVLAPEPIGLLEQREERAAVNKFRRLDARNRGDGRGEIGRASGRERVGQYV